ncbi:carboxypeptidase-like regulatory domain-containing protein [Chitinophagaceae bacterium LB-8]|uniref:Carboxypeptidase-like regulatory domain-containing protein n=1 Tax=Paraflavisolibacter caeni TaxID=2982496 RepID=A0A9X2XPG0_9BACT|nr:carboxypeptidase-like regulatory domain-containing protein [Paraflavisolibacter caeni]MCU7551233.1 carboxypeptidase-like regulatory domain-containing protein [Paraflavisolibacter caeni]
MNQLIKHIKTLCCACILLIASQAQAQYKVQGTVYDSSRSFPMISVSVMSTSGNGTVTDANGHYSISVGEKDSIWFSYLGKPTIKFPVLKIADVTQFDISLQVAITVLKEVKVQPRNYKQDSIQNRLDYAKVFDYRRPNLENMTSIGQTGAGINLDEVIRSFQFRKNKSMLRFQERLLQQEQDKSIDHRFNKALVRRLTNLADEELDRFMALYRPTYEFTLYSNDYDFQLYIKESYKMFMKQKATAQH